MDFNELIELGKKVYNYDEENLDFKGKPVLFHLSNASSDIPDYAKAHCKKLNITNSEFFAFCMFVGQASDDIQEPLRNKEKPNSFIRQIIIELDNLLSKTPKTTAKILYRQDDYSDIENFSENKIITFENYLNTSVDDWDNTNNIIWKIKPKSFNQTKAHEIFRIYDKAEEKQVTFERKSSFKIDKIRLANEKYLISCQEI